MKTKSKYMKNKLYDEHEKFLHTNFKNRNFNFGWCAEDDSISSKIYSDGTNPTVILKSYISGKQIINEIEEYDQGLLLR